MSTLFLIGNGFDVNCGMHTKYKDVYEGYVKTESSTDTIKKFKEDISSDIENWGDFEMAMAKYAESLKDESEFLECIRDFSEYMEKFLIEEVISFKNKFSSNIINNVVAEEVRNSLAKFCFGISHNIDVLMNNRNANNIYNINFISFNYTDSFDYLYRKAITNTPYTVKPIIHIHGVLKDDPVFGVDNYEQIKANYNLSRRAKRAFVKPIFNDEYDRQRVIEAKKLINNASVICVFGMSLGESDLSWRMELVEWLREDKNNQLFIYQYSLSNKNYRTVSEKIDIEEDEKLNILKEWKINDVESIFDQIHIPCGTNIFNIKNAIEIAESQKRELEKKKKVEEQIKMGEEFVNEQLSPKIV